MSHTATNTIWLTRAAHDRLQAELTELSRIAAPAPPVEGRIRELLAVLSRSEVGDKPADGLVEAGMTVTVQFESDREPTTFLLAHRGVTEGDMPPAIDVYSPQSPLGSAIMNKYPGERFRYEAPSGREIRGAVVSATPFREHLFED